jgi:RNA polymerase sigma factor (sigma-70 family)
VDEPAQQFETHRSHLRAVAYRMLGSSAEADDAVQEAWLRMSRSGTDDVANLRGWLTTVIARIALDMLRSRAARREEPLETRLPDPVVTAVDGVDPEHTAVLADSVGLALLVVLETLSPTERLVFVLHDMFAVPFDEIARIVDRTPAAAKQLARGRVVGCGAATRWPSPTSPGNARSSRRSSRRPGAGVSTPFSPCSPPTSCCASTRVRACACCTAPPPSPGRR